MMNPDQEKELLGWNTKQGNILSGGGVIETLSIPNRDFLPSDLPHYYLEQKQ